MIDPAVSESLSIEAKTNAWPGWWRRAVRLGLRFKLISLIIGVTLISIAVSSYLFFAFQRRQLIETTVSNTRALSATLEAGLHHAMLTNDWAMARAIMVSVVEDGSVDTVRILDANAVVGISSVPGETGAQLSKSDTKCQYCHAGGNPSTDKTVIFPNGSASQSLLNVNLIHNSRECYDCHSPEKKVLGLLMIETPLSTLNTQVSKGVWLSSLLALATIALLIGLIVPVLDRSLLKPLGELSKGMAEISAGNLDYQVQVNSRDELGSLAEAFDTMRRDQKASNAEMDRRKQELAILNEVGMAATQLLELQEILDFALDTVVNRLGMEVGLIHLWDEAEQRYTLRASHGLTPEQIAEIDRRRRGGWDITSQVGESGKEVYVANMASDQRFYGVWDHLDQRSYVNFPLLSRGTVVGVMALITPVGHSMPQREMEFLKAVGREIGIAIDNALLLADTRRSEQQAMTLYGHGMRISSSLALHDVLQAVADAARELVPADLGMVSLYDEAELVLVAGAASGAHAKNLRSMRSSLANMGPAASLFAGQPMQIDVEDDGQVFLHDPALLKSEGIASLLAVPLQRGERFLGLVEVMTLNQRRFQPADVLLLQRLAHQVVVSIENAQLYHQLRFLATLEERDRLAREMHDNLAQSLGYLNVKASMTDDLLASGRSDLAKESLAELKRVAKYVYTDVRESIFNLRTTVTSRLGLLATLQEYLAEYRVHYGVDSRLVIEEDDCAEFSPEVASQLLRIVQEALTNIRKHSGASRAVVRFFQDDSCLCLSVEDNGRGFYLEQMPETGRQSYGLQIMRERAESIGGTLVLESRPGLGTQVIVRLPFEDGK